MLVHESKHFVVHKQFFEVIRNQLPKMNNRVVTFVMDRERAFSKAVALIFPKANISLCWNHIKSDVKAKLYDLNAPSIDRIVYMNHLDRLLHSENMATYVNNMALYSSLWTEAFKVYYHSHIEPDLLKYSSRWKLEQLNLYSPNSGITNNISESFNHVLKSFVRPNMPSDLLILAFYKLSALGVMETKRGFADIGNYKLKDNYCDLKIDRKQLDFGNITTDIDSFVKILKNVLTINDKNKQNVDNQNDDIKEEAKEECQTKHEKRRYRSSRFERNEGTYGTPS